MWVGHWAQHYHIGILNLKNIRDVNENDSMQGSYLGPEYNQKDIEKELSNLVQILKF